MNKILCAVDDTDHSLPAIRLAGKLSGALGAELTLFAVNQMIGGYSAAKATKVMWSSADLERILNACAEEAKAAGAANVLTASAGGIVPAEVITTYAQDNGFDHIIIGSGRKGIAFRMVLGSVSRDVVQNAHCTVTVAR